MLTTMLLSMLLMLEGLQGGATAAFHFQHDGKLIYSKNILKSSDGGRQTMRTQPHQRMKSEIHRSLDLESILNMVVTPSPKKSSLPTILRLFPPTAQPLHQHANMPMRFGRHSNLAEDKSPNSSPNMPMRFGRQIKSSEDKFPDSTPSMPQRFGRSWKMIQMCDKCLDVTKPPNLLLHLISGRANPFWSFYRTQASSQLLNAGLHWDDVFNFRKKK